MDDQVLSLVAAAIAAAVLVGGALLVARRLRRGREPSVSPHASSPAASPPLTAPPRPVEPPRIEPSPGTVPHLAEPPRIEPSPGTVPHLAEPPRAAAPMMTSMPSATAPFIHPDVEPAIPGSADASVRATGAPAVPADASARAAQAIVTDDGTVIPSRPLAAASAVGGPTVAAAVDGSAPAAASPPSGPAIRPGSTPPLLRRDEWARAFAIEERRHARYRRPCAVVTVALDGFEALSLRIGAEAAERLIAPLGISLAGRARATDLVCRIDRTRFAALLLETDEVGAAAYARRVRETCQPWLSAGPVAIRLSIGWASPTNGGTLASALVDAERRMGVDRTRPTDEAPPTPGRPSTGYLARIAGPRAHPEGTASV